MTARTARIDFVGRLDGRTELGDGSVRYQARLTRTGVFDYGDHRELRPADEVFKKESVDSFKGLTITEGHRAFIEPANWKTFALGHVGDDVRQDADHLVSSIVVKDAETIARIDAKELVELSMGYTVELDETAGEHEGVKYDSVQRNIVGNHAALGPENWGRAGRTVRILDGAYAGDMPTATPRIDAPATNDKDLETARAERDDAKTKADKLEAERDAARADLAKEKERADKAEASVESKVEAAIALRDKARKILGAKYDFKGKTPRQIHEDALKKVDEKADFAGKADAYVEGRFDHAVEKASEEREDLAEVIETISTPSDAQKSRLDEALETQAKDRAVQGASGAPQGATFKK